MQAHHSSPEDVEIVRKRVDLNGLHLIANYQQFLDTFPKTSVANIIATFYFKCNLLLQTKPLMYLQWDMP